MKEFILDSNPKFSKGKVTIEKEAFSLTKLSPTEGNGYAFTVYKDDCPVDQTHFTYSEIKALFLLLTVNK